MAEQQIRFDDGASYEKFMGVWSRKAGDVFLDWTAPPKGLNWIDVGCGNGAFTELLVERFAPSHVLGVDPSDAQLTFARERHTANVAEFVKADAMALPADDSSFDAAVMALVIFFVPEPAKGVAEMRRVVKPGGLIAAYAWDMMGGGFPLNVMYDELEQMGIAPLMPPSADASKIDALRGLWEDAGLAEVETREITVERSFPGYEDLWATNLTSPRLSQTITGLTTEACELLKARVKERLSPASDGSITCTARAHAIKGRVPG